MVGERPVNDWVVLNRLLGFDFYRRIVDSRRRATHLHRMHRTPDAGFGSPVLMIATIHLAASRVREKACSTIKESRVTPFDRIEPTSRRPRRCPTVLNLISGRFGSLLEKESLMNQFAKIVAGTLTILTAAAGGAQAAMVYIPDGTAGEVLIVDTTTDTMVGRISGLPSIHGLGGATGVPYLVAGSYDETSADEAPAVDKPAGVSEDEHAAHHGAGARSASSASGAVSVLTIIDIADGSPVRRLEVPGAVHHVAVSPDGKYAVATHPNADGVSVVDLTDLAVRGFVLTGSIPNYAVFSPDGKAVYVSNGGDGTVSEIDVARRFVRRNFLAGDSPEHIVLSPDGRTLYVANVDAGTVSALAVESGEIIQSFAIGGELHGLDISDDGGTLFVSGRGENKLVAVDLMSGSLRSAPLGPAPYHLAVVRGTDKLYVSSREESKVWVVDQESLVPCGVIAVRGEGHQMVVLP